MLHFLYTVLIRFDGYREVPEVIKKENTRITITLPRSVHEQLKDEAEYEGRTTSGMAAYIINLHYKNKARKKLKD